MVNTLPSPSSLRNRTRPLATAVFAALVLAGCGTLPYAPLPSPAPAVHATPAHTQAADRARAAGDFDVAAGVGFTGSPGTFLLGGQADYYLDENYAIGGLLQLGLSGDDTLFAPSVNVKRIFGLEPIGEYEWRPFAQAGVGITYLDKDVPGGSVDDTGLLLNVGGGAEIFISDDLTLRSTLMINFMPDKVLGEKSFFSWQIIQFQFQF